MNGLAKKWTQLRMVDDKYYLYAPSDWINHTGIIVSDSMIYESSGDANCYFIDDLEILSRDRFHFDLHDQASLDIRIIDRERGIAVWRFLDKSDRPSHTMLMVDARHVKDFPIIVCDCGDSKCHQEYTFDAPKVLTEDW